MNWAIIMAGGSGTRFWPESRRNLPKQFLNLFGKKTLLEQTQDRLLTVVPRERILVFTSRSKIALTRKFLKLPAANVIGEPVGRNTAPCAAWASSYVLKKDPSAVLGIFPSDHYIRDGKAFTKALRAAYRAADLTGSPVTFGIKPDSPHTGYGYLEIGAKHSISSDVPIRSLKRFHEKPALATAKKYYRSGKFLWNSGIFIWRADCLLEATRQNLFNVFKTITAIVNEKMSQPRITSLFKKLPSISIDHGLMEKMHGQVLTVPVSMGWNDVGGWAALKNLLPKDAKGNVVSGRTLLIDSTGNYLKSGGKLIAALGLSNHVVVETDNAILICPLDQTEAIRKIVSELERRKLICHL